MLKIYEDEINVTENHVAFWGSPLSNFYPCKINYGGIEWKSSEQLFMALKAKTFNDSEILELIINTDNPKDAKKLGRKIRGFDEEIWKSKRIEAMTTAVYSKFSQNEELKDFLLRKEFENKSFVEGSPFDKIWGVGIHYNDESIENEEKWKGLNLLGQILDETRKKLKNIC